MKSRLAILIVALLVMASCGSDDADESVNGGDSGGSTEVRNTDDIDICELLSDAEISAAIGKAPAKEPTEPAGPFTGCKWGGGTLFVQIAPSTTLITAPSESDCPTAGVGEESTMCFGSVKFLIDGIHVTVSTIEDISQGQMLAVAETLLPKLEN